MLRTSLLSALPALLLIAPALSEEIAFYEGPRCTGEPEGVVDTATNGKCFAVPINAESVVLDIQNSNYGEKVSFYSNTDCTGTVEATGNSGCIDFTGLGANAQSYKLSKSSKRQAKTRRDESKWWEKDAASYRELLGIAAENATGSLAPHWDPYAMVDAGYGHGNVTESWGRTWKWQQVALGMTIGIPLEDWDDEVHLASHQFMLFGDEDYDGMLSKRWSDAVGSDLDMLEKRWSYADCRAVLSCGAQYANQAAYSIGTGWAQGVRAAYKLKTYGSTFYDWAHAHPFSVGIATTVGGTVSGYALGYTKGGATAQDNTQLGQCANDSTQVNSFIQALASAAGASSDNTADVDITLPDGNILSISAAVYQKGHKPAKSNECGAGG